MDKHYKTLASNIASTAASLMNAESVEHYYDTLQADDELTLLRAYRATVHCPVLISNNTKVRNDINSFGSLYQTDVARNLSVKNVNRSWTEHYEGTSISVGLTSPVPLYMNNKTTRVSSLCNTSRYFLISLYCIQFWHTCPVSP